MGDRANVYLVDDNVNHGIYLYTHWDGYKWPENLRQALEAVTVVFYNHEVSRECDCTTYEPVLAGVAR